MKMPPEKTNEDIVLCVQINLLLDLLTRRRKKLGFSQEFVRDEFRIDVSKIEKHHHIPNMITFLRLCKIYSLNPGNLIFFSQMVLSGRLSEEKCWTIIEDNVLQEVVIKIEKILDTFGIFSEV